jgi:hypothetical protein
MVPQLISIRPSLTAKKDKNKNLYKTGRTKIYAGEKEKGQKITLYTLRALVANSHGRLNKNKRKARTITLS